MRFDTVMLAVILSSTAATAANATPAAGNAPARDAACVDPGQVRRWTSLGDRRVLIDAGRQRFELALSARCAPLSRHPFLGFISNHPRARVCGKPGDRLVPHGGAGEQTRIPCAIERVRSLSVDEYERRLQQHAELAAGRYDIAP